MANSSDIEEDGDAEERTVLVLMRPLDVTERYLLLHSAVGSLIAL